MRTVGVVTVGRSDYGILTPILRLIRDDPDLDLRLLVSGSHLSPEFGETVRAIEVDGFDIGDRIKMLLSSDTPQAVAKSMGLAVLGFAESYARCRPDILLTLGDRFEMHAAALAALPFKIPVAHVHGGELTIGAIDDALRHSLTKLSHLHFVATEAYRDRVLQLGEEAWRVIVSGAPGVDALQSLELLASDALEACCGLRVTEPFLLVTFHPATLEYERTAWHVQELLGALDASGLPVLFTMPNEDTSGRCILAAIVRYVDTHPSAVLVRNLGSRAYYSAMSFAAAMVGNSSSGIIEAASFDLPVVNVGSRQAGRVRGLNVIDVDYPREAILEGITTALSPEFRAAVRGTINPYGRGDASAIIATGLKTVTLDDRLVMKNFCDLRRERSLSPTPA